MKTGKTESFPCDDCMLLTTLVILSSSSGQMSGQFVKPNCDLGVSAVNLALQAATHIYQTVFTVQVLLSELFPVLRRQLERSANFWPADFG